MRPLKNRYYLLIQQQLRTWFILFVLVVLVVSVIPVNAQEANPLGNQVDGFPITLDSKVLFRIKKGIPGIASARERANIVNQRLASVANDSSIAPEAIQLETRENESVVQAGETVLFTVRDVDAAHNQSRQELAEEVVQTIRTTIKQYREERSIKRLGVGAILTVLSTIALLIFLKTQQSVFSRLLTRIRAAAKVDALSLKIKNLQLLGSDATSYLLSGLIRLMGWTLVLGSLDLYLPFVLSQFPVTKPLGDHIFSDTVQRVQQLTINFAQYLPNLLTLIVIGCLTYFVIGFAKLVITELGRGETYHWFYPEWTQPTIRLATLLIIAIACVVAGPYLPGFGSPAFEGISIFLGALITLGSSSAITNAVAGVILIYTRAFQIGDMIRIGEVFGAVVEKSLFVTRVMTPKKELIAIPNSKVLSGDVTNFSIIQRESSEYLVLHTTITLGYDTPWRKVYEVLIKAAETTDEILLEPRPFVLQTSLNDFHVSYELNAYTKQPQLMPQIYSKLHQNIQDYCNQAEIEILSPTYTSIRDGNHSTIPVDNLPANYTPPAFIIRKQNGHQQ